MEEIFFDFSNLEDFPGFSGQLAAAEQNSKVEKNAQVHLAAASTLDSEALMPLAKYCFRCRRCLLALQ